MLLFCSKAEDQPRPHARAPPSWRFRRSRPSLNPIGILFEAALNMERRFRLCTNSRIQAIAGSFVATLCNETGLMRLLGRSQRTDWMQPTRSRGCSQESPCASPRRRSLQGGGTPAHTQFRSQPHALHHLCSSLPPLASPLPPSHSLLSPVAFSAFGSVPTFMQEIVVAAYYLWFPPGCSDLASSFLKRANQHEDTIMPQCPTLALLFLTHAAWALTDVARPQIIADLADTTAPNKIHVYII